MHLNNLDTNASECFVIGDWLYMLQIKNVFQSNTYFWKNECAIATTVACRCCKLRYMGPDRSFWWLKSKHSILFKFVTKLSKLLHQERLKEFLRSIFLLEIIF